MTTQHGDQRIMNAPTKRQLRDAIVESLSRWGSEYGAGEYDEDADLAALEQWDWQYSHVGNQSFDIYINDETYRITISKPR